jgi:hypothetical protein
MEHVIDILLGVMLGVVLVRLEEEWHWHRRMRKLGRKAMGKFKVHYEVRLEDDDSVLEKGAAFVESDRDGAFPAAVKQVLNSLKGRDRDVVYVACVAVQDQEAK